MLPAPIWNAGEVPSEKDQNEMTDHQKLGYHEPSQCPVAQKHCNELSYWLPERRGMMRMVKKQRHTAYRDRCSGHHLQKAEQREGEEQEAHHGYEGRLGKLH